MPEDFIWRLRLEHEGAASIRVTRRGRTVRFDPLTPPGSDEVAVLTWDEHERVAATAAALREGRRPTVVAPGPVVDWLAERGVVEGGAPPLTVDGLQIEQLAYTPIPYAAGIEILYKARSAAFGPSRAARRMLQRIGGPRCAPMVTQITLPDGGRLLHLNLALHRWTPRDWLDEAVARFGGADWLVAGVDHGDEDAFAGHVGRFEARHLLVTDLVNDVRRALGLPTGLLTPLVDRLVSDGLPAYVFATQASFRYE